MAARLVAFKTGVVEAGREKVVRALAGERRFVTPARRAERPKRRMAREERECEVIV